MKGRGLLQRQVIEAWRQTIADDYGRINSERSLQAAFWGRLNSAMSNNRLILIEPRITLKSIPNTYVIPDIVICNSRTVIGVIELKYQPRVAPRFNKDIDTLSGLVEPNVPVEIQNVRYKGDSPPKQQYVFSPNVLIAWGGVYSGEHALDVVSHGISGSLNDSVKIRFLELHAATNHGGTPEVVIRMNGRIRR